MIRFNMTGFLDKLNRWKLRMNCSDCSKKGEKVDAFTVTCHKCGSTWDARAEFEQQVVMIKEKDTVVSLL